ncbi:MAG: hypothetical protein AB7P69_10715 [Candidatus Binatia bacterium]
MRLYRLANLLNLDVALGALGSMILAASACKAPLPFAWFVLLPLAVWATYTLDHVLDGMRLPSISAAPRHQLARHHALVLTIGVGFTVATLCVGGVLLLPKRILWLSGIVGIITLAHVGAAYAEWYQALPLFSKELAVAALYSAGTWGGPLLVSRSFSLPAMLLSVIFFLIVILNLGLFQWFEHQHEAQSTLNGQRRAPVRHLIDIVFLGLLVALVSAFLLAPATHTRELLLLTVMGGVLWTMRCEPAYFLQYERFRVVGDGVFLLPLFLLL